MTDSILERLPLIASERIHSALPAPWNWIVHSLLVSIAILAVFGGVFAALTLVERKLLGRFQNRPGPNRTTIPGTNIRFFLLQPIADGLKMLTKEDIVPRAADQVLHFIAPVALVAFSLITFAVIPFGRHLVPVDLDAGVLYFFAAGTGTELAIFMAGWASRNKYSLLGAMRALAQLISYELPLLLSFVPVVMIGASLSPSAIVAAQGGLVAGGLVPHWNVLTPWGLVGFLIFVIAALAESNRSPFDLPEAESELIAGHLTEYSGFKYALFFMAEYLGMCALCGMGVTLFLGGWHAPWELLEFIPSYLWFGAKLLALILVFIWIRATLPRLRMDQLMRLSWKFLVPVALLNLGAAVAWQLAAGWILPARWLLSFAIVAGPFLLLGRGLSAKVKPRVYRYA